MTDILKYIDVNPDDAKQRAQRMHVKKDEIQLIRKGYEVKVDEFDDEERTITARVSTADVDRDGEIVSPKGIDLKDYTKNPVLGWCHDYKHPAIGKALWSKIDSKGLVCKFQFAPTQFAGDIYTLYAGGYMRAFSIGFIPMEYDQKTKTHEKISLLEVSAVLVPANQNALVMEAYAKGLIKSPALKKALEIEIEGEEAEAEIHITDEAIREEVIETEEKPEAEAEDVLAEGEGDKAVTQPEVKTFDTEKNPSVWDIIRALDMTINPPGILGAYKMIEDFYPVEYPNGHCIYSAKNEDGIMESFMVDYTYGKGIASLGENPVPVVVAWKRGTKGFKAEGDKTVGEMKMKLSLDADEFNAKIEAIQAKLEEVLKAKESVFTEPKPPVDDVLAAIKCGSCDIPLSVIDIEPDPQSMTPEQVKQAIDKAFSKLDLKSVLSTSVRDTLDRMRGRIR